MGGASRELDTVKALWTRRAGIRELVVPRRNLHGGAQARPVTSRNAEIRRCHHAENRYAGPLEIGEDVRGRIVGGIRKPRPGLAVDEQLEGVIGAWLGEMCGVFRAVFGEYRETVVL